jgi:hypothetical protein
MQGEIQPTIYRFDLGGFEVATILDSKIIRAGLTPSFGGEAGAAMRHDSVHFQQSIPAPNPPAIETMIKAVCIGREPSRAF